MEVGTEVARDLQVRRGGQMSGNRLPMVRIGMYPVKGGYLVVGEEGKEVEVRGRGEEEGEPLEAEECQGRGENGMEGRGRRRKSWMLSWTVTGVVIKEKAKRAR